MRDECREKGEIKGKWVWVVGGVDFISFPIFYLVI